MSLDFHLAIRTVLGKEGRGSGLVGGAKLPDSASLMTRQISGGRRRG